MKEGLGRCDCNLRESRVPAGQGVAEEPLHPSAPHRRRACAARASDTPNRMDVPLR
jgi:hypothetical protein